MFFYLNQPLLVRGSVLNGLVRNKEERVVACTGECTFCSWGTSTREGDKKNLHVYRVLWVLKLCKKRRSKVYKFFRTRAKERAVVSCFIKLLKSQSLVLFSFWKKKELISALPGIDDSISYQGVAFCCNIYYYYCTTDDALSCSVGEAGAINLSFALFYYYIYHLLVACLFFSG